jgi:hypothetical protein
MITYTEKGAGLHEAIRAAGHFLRQENGTWVSSNDIAVQSIIDAYGLNDAYSYISDQIDLFTKSIREKGLKQYSPGEMSAWSIKKAEAEKFQLTNQPSDAPNLQAEATYRGISLTSLATKVLNNFNAVANREAKIAGVAGKHKDNVKALASFAAINSYDWQTPIGLV